MASRSSSVLLLAVSFLLLLCLSPSAAAAASSSSSSSLPARFDSIYQFGDSISDTGNLMRELPLSPCSHPPYGQAIFQRPTGRCSNGLLMVDFLARALSLPLVNPYLQRDADFSHGVNFAVAGATARNASNYPGAPHSSLSVQLGWFRSHLDSICSSSADCKHKKLERSLFLLGEIGGNDYNYDFLTRHRPTEVVSQFIPHVVQSIVNAVNEVIEAGAKTVIVPGNFPIGCMPIYRNNFASSDPTSYDNHGCLKRLNGFARLHNEQLNRAIEELKKQHPNVAIHYGDYYSAFTYVLNNAASLGFDQDKVFEPCCGSTSRPCGSGVGVPLCSEPWKRISWDGIHLTQRAYRNMALRLFSQIFTHHQIPAELV